MADDEIRERHGMRCSDTDGKILSVTINEGDAFIYLDASYHTRKLTAAQARYLARMLRHLANRIDARQETGS